jgi:hypothetical protein
MASYKGKKRSMYATPLGVRMLNKVFRVMLEDASSGKMVHSVSDQEIESHIYNADPIVRSFLLGTYAESDLLVSTPYFVGPVAKEGNSKEIRLAGVTVSAAAITESWRITFTDATTYVLRGSFSSIQGSGAVTLDFSAADGDIEIAAEDWNSDESEISMEAGDELYFATYISHPLVMACSTLLAGSSLFDYLYGESETKKSNMGQGYRDKAMSILRDLVDPKSNVTLLTTPSTTENTSQHVAVPYVIDRYGYDISDYDSITGDYLNFEI